MVPCRLPNGNVTSQAIHSGGAFLIKLRPWYALPVYRRVPRNVMTWPFGTMPLSAAITASATAG